MNKYPTLKKVIEMQPLEEQTIPQQLSLFEDDKNKIIENIACRKILAYIDFLPNKRMREFLSNLTDDEICEFINLIPLDERLKRKLIPSAKEIKRWDGYLNAFRERLRR